MDKMDCILITIKKTPNWFVSSSKLPDVKAHDLFRCSEVRQISFVGKARFLWRFFPTQHQWLHFVGFICGSAWNCKRPQWWSSSAVVRCNVHFFCWLLSTQGHRKNACIFIHYWSHPWHLWKRCCIPGKHTIPAAWPGVHCTRKIRCSTKWRHKLWCSLPNQTIRWNYTCQCWARQRGRWRVFSFRPFSTLSKLQNSKKKRSGKNDIVFSSSFIHWCSLIWMEVSIRSTFSPSLNTAASFTCFCFVFKPFQASSQWMSMIIRHDLPIMPTNLFLPFLPFKIQASTIQPSSSMWSAKTLGLLARDHWCVLVPLEFLVWEMYMSKAWHSITWRLVGKVCFHQAFKTSRFDLTVTWPTATGYGPNWI